MKQPIANKGNMAKILYDTSLQLEEQEQIRSFRTRIEKDDTDDEEEKLTEKDISSLSIASIGSDFSDIENGATVFSRERTSFSKMENKKIYHQKRKLKIARKLPPYQAIQYQMQKTINQKPSSEKVTIRMRRSDGKKKK